MNVRRRKGYYGPEEGKQFIVIFIDDLHMPVKEIYGAQPPIELLRQWMDTGGWYDIESKEWKYLCDITFIAAMQPPGGGRNMISRRYLRHYALLFIQAYDRSSLFRIFNEVLNWYFSTNSHLDLEIVQMNSQMVNATIWIYEQI